jgi:hypothetical protein
VKQHPSWTRVIQLPKANFTFVNPDEGHIRAMAILRTAQGKAVLPLGC